MLFRAMSRGAFFMLRLFFMLFLWLFCLCLDGEEGGGAAGGE